MIGESRKRSTNTEADGCASEVFLPFQLDILSSALIVLQIIRALSITDHDVYALEERAHAIFDEMIAQHNPIAKYRKTEIAHVRELLAPLNSYVEPSKDGNTSGSTTVIEGLHTPASHGPEHPTLSVNDFATTESSDVFSVPFAATSIPTYPLVPNDDFLASFGLSSEALDCVANQVLFDSPLDDFASWTTTDNPH
jgi:hypothetical protein